ncbi:conjugal transfer protein TrbL [Eggerthella lenta]|nr:conjugal transfer protein TrbL [Eggerthella lenta]MBU5399302.1 conjugal transfer protein TrbL [Eggerthella lenta]
MLTLKDKIANRRAVLPFVITFVLLSSLLMFPDLAFADIAGDINKWLCGVLRDCCNWIFTNQINMLKSIGYDGILATSFDSMLGTAGTTTMYSLVHGVWQVAILPIGCGVLSFVFTIKLIQISQRMDGNASFPGIKEVVFLLVFFAVFLFLIQNSFDLMAAIYSVAKLAIERVIDLFGSGSPIDLAAVSIVTSDDDVAALIAMLIVALISWVVVLIAYIVALVVSWARAIQLYLMAAFSPIPLALMGTEDTRQIGIGYIKNFVAVCLAGIIILVLLISFPIILGGLNAANPGTGTPIDSIANGLTYALQYLAMCILLILSLVKSGSWARDIVGG